MSSTHISDQCVVRFNDVHERFDVAWVTCTHLYHRHVVLFVEAQQCFRHANVVVKVAKSV